MNKSSDRRFAYLMLLPAALIVVAVVLYPFIYNFIISMSNMSMRNFHSWNIIGFGQYAKVFGEKLCYSVLA
jgi:ABC-type sugar transport system permease subunit